MMYEFSMDRSSWAFTPFIILGPVVKKICATETKEGPKRPAAAVFSSAAVDQK